MLGRCALVEGPDYDLFYVLILLTGCDSFRRTLSKYIAFTVYVCYII